jgi:hypothetical protein
MPPSSASRVAKDHIAHFRLIVCLKINVAIIYYQSDLKIALANPDTWGDLVLHVTIFKY